MAVTKLDCPSCGAPLKDLGSNYVCEYCGKEVIVEAKQIETMGSEIAKAESKTQDVIVSGSQSTQLELRKMQLTQESSMLEMQLSNLRSEKRRIGLAEKRTRAHNQQIRQIELEEASLLKRIGAIQTALHPALENNLDTGVKQNGGIAPTIHANQMSQSVVFGFAYFLGFFGVHRFITGHKKSGFLYLFTFGIGGFGYLLDLFLIYFGVFKDGQGNLLIPMGRVGKVLATIALFILVVAIISNMAHSGSPATVVPTPIP